MKALLCFFFISARYLKILLLLKVVINYNAMTNKTAPKFTFTSENSFELDCQTL